jgi:hypothetical protein
VTEDVDLHRHANPSCSSKIPPGNSEIAEHPQGHKHLERIRGGGRGVPVHPPRRLGVVDITAEQRHALVRAAEMVTHADYASHDSPEWKARVAHDEDVRGIREAFGDAAQRVLYTLD